MRLLFKPGPMRFTPIVEQARGRPIRIGMGVTLGQHVAGAAQQTEGFVAGLMIENHEFPEVRSLGQVDDGFPAAGHLFAGERA